MAVKFARPSLSELTFQVFGRSVHPELFQTFESREFECGLYVAAVHICEAGHIVAFRTHDSTVTEIAASRHQPLPRNLRSYCQKLSGSRHRSVCFENEVKYEFSYHVEHLDPDVFLNFHQELLTDLSRVELSHAFPAGNRFAPEPLSLVRADAQPESLLIHSYHTFPESSAVVKSQSLFELM